MQIDAKNKFREGFIMLTRPFNFGDMKNPIQKLTIVYAYSERPIIEERLTEKAIEEIEDLYNRDSFINPTKFLNETQEEYLERKLEEIYSRSSNFEGIYKGDVVQCIIDGQICRFYPDEYNIISQEKLNEIMSEEGYHAITSLGLESVKAYKDTLHYIQSRGVSEGIAKKWAGLSFRDLIYFKPYYGLLEMFCRENEIYRDEFYERVEGIIFNK
jgi:hypothetical protein